MAIPTANQLVTALIAGRQEAYVLLYDRLGRSLLRVASVMLNNSLDAEDVVHDIFVELVRRREKLALVRDLDAYLFAMLRHAIIRKVQRKQSETTQLHRLNPTVTVERSENFPDDLQFALTSLPAEQREVISLKIDVGLTFAQIAEILCISPNTAASRYRYALEKLRKTLE